MSVHWPAMFPANRQPEKPQTFPNTFQSALAHLPHQLTRRVRAHTASTEDENRSAEIAAALRYPQNQHLRVISLSLSLSLSRSRSHKEKITGSQARARPPSTPRMLGTRDHRAREFCVQFSAPARSNHTAIRIRRACTDWGLYTPAAGSAPEKFLRSKQPSTTTRGAPTRSQTTFGGTMASVRCEKRKPASASRRPQYLQLCC